MTDQLQSEDVAPPEAPAAALSTADRDTPEWFAEHYITAAGEIVDFLAGDEIDLGGRDVADVGCGDGIIDLGVAHRGKPRSLVGFDIVPTDAGWLLARARAEGVAEELPDCLEFRTCEPTSLPAEDASCDVVFTWSAFEHVEDPAAVFREVRRVLRPAGVLMLQIWPLYFSEHGAHLWQCLPDSFIHLLLDHADLEEAVRSCGSHSPDVHEEFLHVFRTLNRVTVDDLQRAMLAAGLRVVKLELQCESVHIPTPLTRRSLPQLGISGVKLLAVPG